MQISGEKMILYQGAVNQGRGLENAIRAMKYISGATLSIAGSGDILEQLRHLVKEEGLGGRVRFSDVFLSDDLSNLTLRADLGLSLEEDLGLNYRYALPNKLFDYVQANVPVLVSDLPEMSAIVRKYSIGERLRFPQNLRIWQHILPKCFSMRKNVQFGKRISKKLLVSSPGRMKNRF